MFDQIIIAAAGDNMSVALDFDVDGELEIAVGGATTYLSREQVARLQLSLAVAVNGTAGPNE